MNGILCLGELLIDFVPEVSGVSLAEAPGFLKAPGGAPGNVAVGVRRLGRPSGFLGMVGDDAFGRFLCDTLAGEGVDTGGIRLTDKARTALAFVTLNGEGDREFSFYRHPSADMLYTPDDVDAARVRAAQVLHYGSISMIDEPSRSATLHAIDVAAAAGIRISCDPNLREALWPSLARARDGLRLALSRASVIKISDYEVEFLTDGDDLAAGARSLWHDGVDLMAVTKGPGGCLLLTADRTIDVPGFAVEAIDTTGAGDAFTASLLTQIVDGPDPNALDVDTLRTIGRRANACGALATLTRGAIPALPTTGAVDRFLARRDAD